MVYIERGKGGHLICSMPGKGGGYYLPADKADIFEMKRRLEKGFVRSADNVRPFRKAVKGFEKETKDGTNE